jgi:hypothetical protein
MSIASVTPRKQTTLPTDKSMCPDTIINHAHRQNPGHSHLSKKIRQISRLKKSLIGHVLKNNPNHYEREHHSPRPPRLL